MNNTDDDTDNKIINYLHNYIYEIGICRNIIEKSKDPLIPLNFWFNKYPELALLMWNYKKNKTYRFVKPI